MGYRVKLSRLSRADEQAFIQAAQESIDLHRPWGPVPADPAAFRAYLARFSDADRAMAFTARAAETLVGWTTLSAIQAFPYYRAVIGYTGFAAGVGRGYMTDAVSLTVRYGFDLLGLHRIEADIQPGNARSRRLLERLGFRQEGFSPEFLMVDGTWRDHERWAITKEMTSHYAPYDPALLPDRD